MNMEKLYQENILEHYRHPHHFGHLRHADTIGSLSNPLCGDEMAVELSFGENKIKNNGGKDKIITAASFTGKGCAISTASASMLLEKLPGKTMAEVDSLCSRDVLELLGIEIGPSRMKCAFLVLDSIRKAMTEYEEKAKK